MEDQLGIIIEERGKTIDIQRQGLDHKDQDLTHKDKDLKYVLRGSSIKDIRKNDPFYTPLSAFDQPLLPLCGRPHLASYTAPWSDSIAGAVKIRCSLISSGHFTYPMWVDMWVM